jgi:serine phosphatase RsbU (regulator of sigma subunit)
VEKANLIISSQKEQVEIQKDLIASQKILVEEKQKEMIDSIQYAKKIQHAVLTGEEIWNRVSREHFIFYQPKDIVSGDFYWAYHTPNNRSIWVVADCTGHGVPGGFMSMLGNSFLNEIVVDKRIYKPDEILNRLREKVISALEQKGESSQQDGMDISVAVWNKVENKFEFSAANNSGILIRDGEVVDLAADKMPVGKYLGKENPFTIQSFELKKGDTIYLFTDGFADQFGGDKGKKLKYRNFVNLLLELSSGNMQFQESLLRQKFKDWKGDLSQTDDVCVLGVRVS